MAKADGCLNSATKDTSAAAFRNYTAAAFEEVRSTYFMGKNFCLYISVFKKLSGLRLIHHLNHSIAILDLIPHVDERRTSGLYDFLEREPFYLSVDELEHTYCLYPLKV